MLWLIRRLGLKLHKKIPSGFLCRFIRIIFSCYQKDIVYSNANVSQESILVKTAAILCLGKRFLVSYKMPVKHKAVGINNIMQPSL